MELPLLSCHFIDKNPRIPYIPVNDTADTNILIQNTVVQLLHTLCNVKLNKDIGLLSSFGKYSLMVFKRGTFPHIPFDKIGMRDSAERDCHFCHLILSRRPCHSTQVLRSMCNGYVSACRSQLFGKTAVKWHYYQHGKKARNPKLKAKQDPQTASMLLN